MSGVPYVHSDAGGFAGGDGDNELYVRWLQFAAFTPVFRPHGTALYEVEPAAGSFPSEAALIDTPWRKYAKEAIYQRYSFLPYNYSLAYEQQKYGKPLIAPLYYHFPADTIAVQIPDQFMWGEHVMVAPVLDKGVQYRKFYLPAGKWYNINKRQVLEGSRWHTQSVGISEFPLLVKEGTFLPMAAATNAKLNTSRYSGDILSVLYVVSARPSTYSLFNDDGHSHNSVAKKQYELVTFTSSGVYDRKLKLKITSDGGSYPAKPKTRTIIFILASDMKIPSGIKVNGKPVKFSGSEDRISVSFKTIFSGKPLDIKVTW
jgi:oligosaccharide 4-alpha-D-glucosyltransferase